MDLDLDSKPATLMVQTRDHWDIKTDIRFLLQTFFFIFTPHKPSCIDTLVCAQYSQRGLPNYEWEAVMFFWH